MQKACEKYAKKVFYVKKEYKTPLTQGEVTVVVGGADTEKAEAPRLHKHIERFDVGSDGTTEHSYPVSTLPQEDKAF